MKQRRSTEDYLKTIYILSREGPVRGAEIATRLHLSRPTVSVSLKALEEEGQIRMHPDHRVSLTEQGEAIAREIYDRPQMFRELLICLGVDEAAADRDACELEHSVGPESTAAFRAALARMKE